MHLTRASMAFSPQTPLNREPPRKGHPLPSNEAQITGKERDPERPLSAQAAANKRLHPETRKTIAGPIPKRDRRPPPLTEGPRLSYPRYRDSKPPQRRCTSDPTHSRPSARIFRTPAPTKSTHSRAATEHTVNSLK